MAKVAAAHKKKTFITGRWVPWSPAAKRVDAYEGTKGRSNRGPLEARYVRQTGGVPAPKNSCGVDVIVGGLRHEVKKMGDKGERTPFFAGDSGTEAVSRLRFVCETIARHSLEWLTDRKKYHSENIVKRANDVVRSLSRGELPEKTLQGVSELLRVCNSDVEVAEMSELEAMAHEAFQDPAPFWKLVGSSTRASLSFPDCDVLALVHEDWGYALVSREEMDKAIEFCSVSKGLPRFRVSYID